MINRDKFDLRDCLARAHSTCTVRGDPLCRSCLCPFALVDLFTRVCVCLHCIYRGNQATREGKVRERERESKVDKLAISHDRECEPCVCVC